MSGKFYVGVDWGAEKHAICITDSDGKILGERFFEHSGAGLAAMCTWLFDKAATQDPALFVVGIEVPRGPVVSTLLERGMAVHSINPKQSDRFRDRFAPSGAKDDKRDARVLASAVRTDLRAFRSLVLDHPIIIEIREWSRIAEDLSDDRVRYANQFRDQLLRYYPEFSSLSHDIANEWVLALWQLAPTPAQGAKLTTKKVAKLLHDKKVYSLDPAPIAEKLRQAPLVVAPGVASAAQGRIATLIEQLRTVNRLQKQALAKLETLFDQLGEALNEETEPGQKCEQRDVEILRSLPGVGRIVLAALLAEAWQALCARDYGALRNLCGAAPVTQNSGKKTVVKMRTACNHRLRDAVFFWAGSAIRSDPKSKVVYAELRARGASHGRALRSVADRLLKLVCAMLKSQSVYDPSRRALIAA